MTRSLMALGDLVTVRRESVPPEAIPEGCRYVGLEHITPATGELTNAVAGDRAIRSTKLRFERGDVLYGKLRPNLRKCAVAGSGGVCSTEILPLVPREPALAHLIAVCLRSEAFAGRVSALVAGANLPRVSPRDLLAVRVGLPAAADADRLAALAELASRVRADMRRTARAVEDLERALAEECEPDGDAAARHPCPG